jgi:hypothetical protein
MVGQRSHPSKPRSDLSHTTPPLDLRLADHNKLTKFAKVSTWGKSIFEAFEILL